MTTGCLAGVPNGDCTNVQFNISIYTEIFFYAFIDW